MAHIDKATRLQANGLFRHDMRLSKDHTNVNINPSLTKNNYNLISDNPLERYQKRLNELYVLNRKDVNTLCEIVITLPEEVEFKDHNKFFKTCTENFINYFGSENVVSAAVHMDETTPHIHLKAIPVYFNEKKQREQVSFDKKCPRDFYKNYHKKLSEDIELALGYKTSIIKNDTIKRNESMQDFKKHHNTDDFDNFIKQRSLEQENEKLKNIVQVQEKDNLNEIHELYEEIDELKQSVAHLSNKNELLNNLIETIIGEIMEHTPKLHAYLCNKFSNYRAISDSLDTQNNFNKEL